MATNPTLRVEHLDEIGDENAPAGSRAWAAALRLRIWSLIRDAESSATHLRRSIEAMESHAGYRVLDGPDGEPFASFEAFCTAPTPWGLGYDAGVLRRIIHERESAQARAAVAEPLANPGGDRKSPEYQGSDTTLIGRGADYLTARIARDRPDILERMKSGEFRSVRQAAMEAGIVKSTITLPADVTGAARVLRRHFDVDALIAALSEDGG